MVETYSGGGVDVFSPDSEAIRLEDISAGLAHTCRFGGQCLNFYSVAHHSLHVSSELTGESARIQLLGLLHDAGEASLGDIPRPLKTEVNGVEAIEARVLEAVWSVFGIDSSTESEWEQVMAADDRLLSYEATHLLQGGDWAGDAPDRGYDLDSNNIEQIRDQFTARAESVLTQV